MFIDYEQDLTGSGDFDVTGLSSIGQQGGGDGLLVGLSVPLFDAGLREDQVREAKSRADMAADEFQRVQTAAVTEIVTARNALRTALESHSAADHQPTTRYTAVSASTSCSATASRSYSCCWRYSYRARFISRMSPRLASPRSRVS
ncbi:TolC family protein [Lamprobacter modestohalophilus]|uniref:TolC family protein n=1 Tax=Lamprobacter modestohalophilus TaxID=1064514 RepID=UPI003D18C314